MAEIQRCYLESVRQEHIVIATAVTACTMVPLSAPFNHVSRCGYIDASCVMPYSLTLRISATIAVRVQGFYLNGVVEFTNL